MYYNNKYYYHNPYPVYPPAHAYPGYYRSQPIPRDYPPVDVKIFTHSVKSFRLLMEQGSILLDRLGDVDFAHKMMEAAQQGKKVEVDQLLKTMGLQVPVEARYTPSGVTFELRSPQTQNVPANCCTLSVHMKWGI
jgi:hypothetical protein